MMTARYARGSAAVFVIALGLRLLWVVVQTVRGGAPADPSEILNFPDEVLHWELARNLAHEGLLVSEDGRYAARMPLYPLFLAPFTYFGTVGIGLARLVQAVIGAATAVIVYRFGRRAIGNEAGLLAGLLVCFDPFAVFFSNLLLTENFFTLLAVSLTYGCWKALHTSPDLRVAGLATIAVCGAAAVLTRPSSAGWVMLTWLIAAIPETTWLKKLRVVGVLAGILFVTLLPWAVRNWFVVDAFVWLGTNSGISLYDAQHAGARGDSKQEDFIAELMQDPNFAALGEAARDREFSHRAWQAMRADPTRVAELAVEKVLRTWRPWPNEPQHRRGLAAVVGAFFTIAVLLATLVGGWRLLQERRAINSKAPAAVWLLLILLLPAIYFTAVHSLYVGSVRYRIPVMPMLCIVAGSALAGAQHRPRTR